MSKERFWILITYDVNVEEKEGRRRLRQVAKTCERYGQRVQKSVFELEVDALLFERLHVTLRDKIDEQKDSLRIYRLGVNKDRNIWHYGINNSIDFNAPMIL
ncbi:MAG: CRISPR-associated endonuclease Cas2 [Campylobacterales bacterium]|nr:CRISPR-associated endonuclease Cas2 [Campylobacterales bacterium]